MFVTLTQRKTYNRKFINIDIDRITKNISILLIRRI